MSRLYSLSEFHSEFVSKAALSVILCILITCPFIFFILSFPSQVSRAPWCCCRTSSLPTVCYVIAQFCPTLLKEKLFLVWPFPHHSNMLSLLPGEVTYFWRMWCHPEEPGQTEGVHLWEEKLTEPSARCCTWTGTHPSVTAGCRLSRGTWQGWWKRGWAQGGNVHLQPSKPILSWAASKEVWPAGWNKWFCPATPLSWDLTWRAASSTRRTSTCWSKSRGGARKWSDGWSTSSVRQTQRSGVV